MQAFWYCLIILLSSYSNAQEGTVSSTREFEIKRQYQLDRIEDYYTRIIQKERSEQARNEGADLNRIKRKNQQEDYEKSRLEYVKIRKQKSELSPIEWEKEARERQLARDRARADYVKKREAAKMAQKNLPQISEEEEFEIDLNLNDEVL